MRHFPLDLGLNPQELQAIQDANSDLIHFNKFFNGAPDIGQMMVDIKARCQSRSDKSCYIPSGWSKSDAGHYVTLKARLLDDGRLAFSFLNYGAGVQFHASASFGETKIKPDYRSDECAMGEKETRDFLQRIISLHTDLSPYTKENQSVITAYNETDLYGLLNIFGTPIPKKSSSHGVTAQRSGTCTASNTRAASLDVLLELHLSPIRLKRFQFAMKFASIVECFKSYKHAGKRDLLVASYLREAITELDTRCQKFFPGDECLNAEEFALAQAVSKKIALYLNEEQVTVVKTACAEQVFPSIRSSGIFEMPREVELKVEGDLNSRASLPKATQPIIAPLQIGTCEPTQVRQYLEGAKKYFSEKAGDRSQIVEYLVELRALMRSLPITSGQEEDAYWDKVPAEDISSILESLVAFRPKKGRALNDWSIHVEFEIGVIAYDIAAHLAYRCPEAQLGNQFTFAFDHVFEGQFFFHEADSYDVVQRVASNFTERSKNRQPIFGDAMRPDSDRFANTEKYVMRHLMTDAGRTAWLRNPSQREHLTDSQMFQEMLLHHCGFDEPYVPESCRTSLQNCQLRSCHSLCGRLIRL